MDIFTLTFISIGLTADAFAVAVTNGIFVGELNKKHIFATATVFGLFQNFMPIIGFALACNFSNVIMKYQHWVAFILLLIIGVNMIVEYIKDRTNPELYDDSNSFSLKNIILQGIATSIDALAVGVSFVALEVNILPAAMYIGIITFILSGIGVILGTKFSGKIGSKAKLIGGILLTSIGLKILLV